LGYDNKKVDDMSKGFPLHLEFRKNIKESSMFYRLLPSYVPWRPIGLSLAITNNCNLRCKMCSRTANLKKLKIMNMSKKVYLEALKYVKNKDVTFCGLGETLCHPNLFEFIKLANDRNNKVYFTTNANLLTEKIAKELLKYDIESIAFSIDGVDDNYNRIRNGGNFDTVIENIKRFAELKREYGKEKPVFYVSFVGMKSNIQDLPKLIEILGPYIYNVGVLHPVIFSKKLINEHLNKNVKLAQKAFKQIEEAANKYNLHLILKSLQPSPRGCLEPWIKPYIGIDGTVYPCCMIGGNSGLDCVDEYYDNFKTNLKLEDFAFGNIMEQTLYEIWNNNRYVEFRKKLKKIIINSMKNKWNEKLYIKMLNQKGPNIFHCEFCPYRWNCGA
jgi:MoaA/NifB/PqqE/SkfB family radical SAM enzyme